MNKSNMLNTSRGLRIGGLAAAVVLIAGLLTSCQLAPDVALGGKVTTPNGAVVGQITIGVYSNATTQVTQATSNGYGDYRIKNTALTAGTYRIKVADTWYGGNDYASATPVTVTSSPTRLNLTAADASDVTGTLVDPTNHDPMPNTAVVAYDTNGHTVGVAATATDGTFDLGAPAGATITIKVLTTGNTLATLGGATPTPVTTTAGNSTDIGTLTVNHATQIAAGTSHTCALQTDTTVKCWGYNGYGELGNNSTTASQVPVQVSGVDGTGTLTGVTAITAGTSHTCALRTDHTVDCWGYNYDGQLGNNSTTDSHVPVQVSGVDGTGTLTGVTAITAGTSHTCALQTDSTVKCWGYNGYGELGNNSTTQSSVPVQVSGVDGTGTLGNITAITAGAFHTCAVQTDHTVDCWGYNGFGQLGNNSTTQSSVPVQVHGVDGTGTLGNITAITAGDYHTCAVQTDSTVDCWGYNGHGELGNNSTTQSSVPVQVHGVDGTGTLGNITAITAGADHTCALRTDSTVDCWGDNSDGELGNNSTTESHTPVQVLGLPYATIVPPAAS